MASLLNMSGGSLLNKGSLLPSGYTQVEYIENTSTAYTMLSFPVDTANIEYHVTVEWSTLNGRQLVIGNDAHYFGTNESDWDVYRKGGIVKLNTIYDCKYVAVNSGNAEERWLYVDGDLIINYTSNRKTVKGIRIFTIDCPNAFMFNAKCKIYGIKIYSPDGFEFNLYPCISPDNVAGFYETVEGKFYSSFNNVAFIAGPVIS